MSKKTIAAKTSGLRVAVFPGSFDPFTWGHLEVIHRALSLFDTVVVGVGISGSKVALFSPEERVKMIEEACQKIQGVEVKIFSGLAVDFAQSVGALGLIRGLRSEADFSYEMPIAMANRALAKNLETIFIPTDPKFCFVSSSLVKEIGRLGGDLSSMVPTSVSKKLAEKFKVR